MDKFKEYLEKNLMDFAPISDYVVEIGTVCDNNTHLKRLHLVHWFCFCCWFCCLFANEFDHELGSFLVFRNLPNLHREYADWIRATLFILKHDFLQFKINTQDHIQ